jgi:hypothetical protein
VGRVSLRYWRVCSSCEHLKIGPYEAGNPIDCGHLEDVGWRGFPLAEAIPECFHGDVSSSCSSNTDRTVLNHGKRSGKFCLVLLDGTGDDTALFLIANAIDAIEHNAAVVKSLPIDEFAKILVFGDQYPCVLHGYFKDDVVASSLKLLSHPPDIMAVATDGTDDRSVHALVGEESHADSRSPTE